jgi:hypothetical protein
MIQGLCLGGQYGGAITYVAEHVSDERRGYYTGCIAWADRARNDRSGRFDSVVELARPATSVRLSLLDVAPGAG